MFTDADTDPTVDAAHLLGRIQGRELAERETPAEGAVLRVARARGGGRASRGVNLIKALRENPENVDHQEALRLWPIFPISTLHDVP